MYVCARVCVRVYETVNIKYLFTFHYCSNCDKQEFVINEIKLTADAVVCRYGPIIESRNGQIECKN